MKTSMHRKSVLHFIDTTGPGGAETVFLDIGQGMRERGWRSHMVVTGPGWVLDRVNERDLSVDVVETRGRFDLRYLLRLRSLVDRRRIDLIHAHLFSPAVYASLISTWKGIPVVATLHGASDVAAGGWFRELRYSLISRQAEVACVSESVARELGAEGRRRIRRLHVVHNGVEGEPFRRARGRAVRQEHRVPAGTFLVGSLGNVRAAKDYANLLRAAALVSPDLAIAFAVVGQKTEPLYGQLLRLRNELGLEDRVSFWGFRHDVAEVVAAFDMLAISSSSEGFSLAAIQAMHAGKPVVATRCGGPEEILTDGFNGLLVPTARPEAMAAAIERVHEDPELRARLASSGRDTAARRFSTRAMLDGYESLYRHAIARRSGRNSVHVPAQVGS